MTTAAPTQRRFKPAVSISGLRALAGKLTLPLIVLLPIALFAPFFYEPFEGDEGAYGTIAQQMMHGMLPYRDLFDHKPPLIYVWYAASFLVLGQNIVAPRIFAALTWSATTLLVFVQAKLLLTHRQALIAAGLFALSASLTMLSFNANTEVFLLLPLVGASVAFTRAHQTGNVRWLVLAGLCGGLASLTKQVAVWNLAAMALMAAWPLWKQRNFRRLLIEQAALAGSALFVLAIVIAPWVVSGAVSDFYYATVTYNGMYSNRLSLSERISFTFYGLQAFTMIAAPYVGLTLLALPAAFKRRTFADVLFMAMLAAGMFGVATSGLYFRHYFVVLLPFAALLSAPYVESVFTAKKQQFGFVVTMTFLVMVGLFFNGPAFVAATPAERHTAKFLEKQASRENSVHLLADYIAAHTEPGEPIYDYGRATQVYFYADRPPAIEFMYDRPFWLDSKTLDKALAALWANPPRYVTDSVVWKDYDEWQQYHPQRVLDFFAANYDYVGRVQFADVYKRKAQPLPGYGP